MMTLCSCALNGVDPRGLSPAVIITDVREYPVLTDRQTIGVAAREGSRVLRERKEALSVSIDFELHELDPLRRRDLCRQLAKWAAPGGWLSLSDRPGQRLRVSCDAPPTLVSVLNWTQPVTVTFTAWEAPWWEDETLLTVHSSGRSGAVTLRPSGDRPTVLQATIPVMTAVNALSITAGGRTLRLEGLAMAPYETLTFDYDELQLPRLRVGERSVLHCRTADSPEDLPLQPRADNPVSWSADGILVPQFSARGRYL